ncbi:hypothetical protein JG687_00016876 [Phytophthora cactorum]|uniref:Uncharacterized protein n=1 Tax=Phytophthora cactorum TaxID=29920 RepID=A0A8T1TSP7_9STRA|nr:hypothetical protein JG687_00016876 [Phytophthora cactorum]
MIASGRVTAYETGTPALCHVKQLPKDEITTFGPEPLAREQRARAASLYNTIVAWSLWYARSASMPEERWIVDVQKCVCGCKLYAKFKSCCHAIIGRKARRLGRPGTTNTSEKLFSRQVRKKKTPNDLPPINKSKKTKSFLLHHRLQQSR